MKKFFKIFCGIQAVLFLLGSVGIIALGLWLSPLTHIQMDLSKLPKLKDGAPAKLYVQNQASGTWVEAESSLPSPTQTFKAVTNQDLPKNLSNAFIAIEDKRFETHHGIDFWRTGHACINYLLGKRDTFGGSTITQQLVKNITHQNERTPQRKITEMFYAIDLEQHLHKDEIMEAYVNVINLGNGCRGVGAAARYYFDKDIKELSLCECASIAAITNHPTYYDPKAHPQNNLRRRNIILDAMYEQGFITQSQCQDAKSQPIRLAASCETIISHSSWYADMVTKDVINDLQRELGYTYDEAVTLVYHGDLVIETAMDTHLQEILTAYYEDISHFPNGEFGIPQSAMMVIDPYTGNILAVAGGVGEKMGDRVQNFATDTKRPAGSSIKPLSIYAPALEENIINFSSVWEDAPIESKNGTPWPKNADGLYRGKISVSESVARSTNTIPVKILEQLGIKKSFDFLKNSLHMESLIAPNPNSMGDATISSLALGQQSRGVTLRELLGGYTICYEGVYHTPTSYHRVLTAEGDVLLSKESRGEVVLSTENACILTKLLEGVVQEGTASSLTLGETLDISVAGKTGTTQNNCDRWFVGLTPRLAAAVWVGYEYPLEMRGITGNPALRIWDDVMISCERTYKLRGGQSHFETSSQLVPLTVCPISGLLATSDCLEHMALTSADEFPALKIGWFDAKKLLLEECQMCRDVTEGTEG